MLPNWRAFKDSAFFFSTMARMRPRWAQVSNLTKFGWHYFLLGSRADVIRSWRPVSVGVYINQKCNLKCSFCYLNWDDVDNIPRENMTLEEFDRYMDHPLCRDAVRCAVGGGEPLLHKDYFEFVKRARGRRMYTATHTNGLLIERRLDEFVKDGPDSINISLYDEFMDRQLKQAKALVDAYRSARAPKQVTFCRIVNNENYAVIEKIIEAALETGVGSVFFQNQYPSSWPAGEVDKTAFHLPIWNTNGDYKAYVDQMKRKYGRRLRVQWPGLLTEKPASGETCLSLMGVINFDKNGTHAPCCYIAPPLPKYGNINEEDSWNSKFYRFIRNSMHKPGAKMMEACEQCALRGGKFVKIY